MYILQSIREGRTQRILGPWNRILRRRKHRVSHFYGLKYIKLFIVEIFLWGYFEIFDCYKFDFFAVMSRLLN